jgi:peptidylprolyl isomerase/FKBP-type peptidyl-prolyl cis-trans isomerase SlpA
VAKAKNGDAVQLHYRGTLEDGTMFGFADREGPLELTLGQTEVIAGLQEAIIGMEEGDSKTVHLSPDDAFGEHRQELVATVEKTSFPSHVSPEVGMNLVLKSSDENSMNVTVTAVDEDTVTLDGNHPLAGKELTFEITLVQILEQHV